MMLFRSKSDSSKADKFQLVQESTEQLRKAVTDLADEIRDLHQQLVLKDEKIAMLESILRSDEVFIDPDTKAFNRHYFNTYLKPHMTVDHSVITITIRHWDEANESQRVFRRQLAKMLHDVCINPSDSVVQWHPSVFKLFLGVSAERLTKVRDAITALLTERFNQRSHSLSMSFLPMWEDNDLR